MSNIRYSEHGKNQRGRYVWGVLQMEGRKQKFQTVDEGEGARRKAKKLAQHLSEMEKVAESPEDRFLAWHRSGEPLPLDRAIRAPATTFARRRTPRGSGFRAFSIWGHRWNHLHFRFDHLSASGFEREGRGLQSTQTDAPFPACRYLRAPVMWRERVASENREVVPEDYPHVGAVLRRLLCVQP
jgi:hypothetical protein